MTGAERDWLAPSEGPARDRRNSALRPFRRSGPRVKPPRSTRARERLDIHGAALSRQPPREPQHVGGYVKPVLPGQGHTYRADEPLRGGERSRRAPDRCSPVKVRLERAPGVATAARQRASGDSRERPAHGKGA